MSLTSSIEHQIPLWCGWSSGFSRGRETCAPSAARTGEKYGLGCDLSKCSVVKSWLPIFTSTVFCFFSSSTVIRSAGAGVVTKKTAIAARRRFMKGSVIQGASGRLVVDGVRNYSTGEYVRLIAFCRSGFQPDSGVAPRNRFGDKANRPRDRMVAETCCLFAQMRRSFLHCCQAYSPKCIVRATELHSTYSAGNATPPAPPCEGGERSIVL